MTEFSTGLFTETSLRLLVAQSRAVFIEDRPTEETVDG